VGSGIASFPRASVRCSEVYGPEYLLEIRFASVHDILQLSLTRRALPSKICRKGSALQTRPCDNTSRRSSAMVWSPRERPSPRAAARSNSTALPLRGTRSAPLFLVCRTAH